MTLVEDDGYFSCQVIREVEQLLSRRHGDQDDRRTPLDGDFHHVDGVVERVNRAAQVQAADNDHAAAEALVDQGTAHRHQSRHAQAAAGLAGVIGPKLDGKLVFARIPVAHKLGGP